MQLATMSERTRNRAEKWLGDTAEFSRRVMKRARHTDHSDAYVAGNWPEPGSNARLPSPDMLLNLK